MRRRDTFRLIPLGMAAIGSIANRSYAFENQSVGLRKCPHEEVGAPSRVTEYADSVSNMLRWIRETQSENILEAAYAVARTIEKGGTCWSFWDQGHTHYGDIFPDRNGDPGLVQVGYDPKKSRKGDCFLVSYPLVGLDFNEVFDDVVKKNIFVIGSPSPVYGDCRRSEENIPKLQNTRVRPYSKIWIDTPITSTGAVMKFPGQPPLGPVSSPIYLTLWWMIQAETCRILARKNKTFKVKGDSPKLSGDNVPWIDLDVPIMDNYFDETLRQLDLIEAEYGDVRKMAGMAVDTLLSGGSVHFYSRYIEMLCGEATYRRGGFFFAKQGFDGDIRGSSGDMVVMGITKPDDERDLANLDEYRKRGMKVASIGPVTRDFKIPEGRTVPKETDVHTGRMMDTYGMFAVPGFDRKVCPTTGLMNIAILWSMSGEIVKEMLRRTGNVPGIYWSGALKWSQPHNSQMRSIVTERGY